MRHCSTTSLGWLFLHIGTVFRLGRQGQRQREGAVDCSNNMTKRRSVRPAISFHTSHFDAIASWRRGACALPMSSSSVCAGRGGRSRRTAAPRGANSIWASSEEELARALLFRDLACIFFFPIMDGSWASHAGPTFTPLTHPRLLFTRSTCLDTDLPRWTLSWSFPVIPGHFSRAAGGWRWEQWPVVPASSARTMAAARVP